MGMRNIDRIESSSQRRIDIRAGRIAHHPGMLRVNPQLAHDTMVGGNIFFWHDDHLPEEPLNPRPFDLELLFFDLALREQEKVVSRRQVGQRLSDSLKELQGLSANAFTELAHLLDILLLQVLFRKTTIGFDQALCEIGRSIAHQTFYLIEHRPYLLPRESRVIKEGHKGMNGLLKIDIVLPEG